MRFCPKCGGIMLPSDKKGDKIILRCTRCGYTIEVDTSSSRSDFMLETRVPKEERIITTSRISEGKLRRRDIEEWEQEREEYREVLLEQLQEELEGEGE